MQQGKDAKKQKKAFNFEEVRVQLRPSSIFLTRLLQEKPLIMTAIANASTAANNLVNAITVSTGLVLAWIEC